MIRFPNIIVGFLGIIGCLCCVVGFYSLVSLLHFRSGAIPIDAEVIATKEKILKGGTPPGVVGRERARRGDIGGFVEYLSQDATIKLLGPLAPPQQFVLSNQHNLMPGMRIPVWYHISRAEVRRDITWALYFSGEGIFLITGFGLLLFMFSVSSRKRRKKR